MSLFSCICCLLWCNCEHFIFSSGACAWM